MLKNLIVIENSQKYQFDTLKELVETIIDKNYYKMSDEEKTEKLKLQALANSLGNQEILSKINTKDEISYIFSLLLINKFMLLENVNSNIFTQYMDKVNLNGNYIIVNNFSKELLKKHLERG